jgi:predicted tellurium resistance membrane protein TerC
VILGVDNIIFISLVAGRLPAEQQAKARNIGLMIALLFRVGLLLSISWIIGLTAPIFTLPLESIFADMGVHDPAAAAAISGRDLILFAGGVFLLAKSTTEIHHKVSGVGEGDKKVKAPATMFGAITQIILIDIVFSFDSILTAVGLTPHVMVMIFAVVISMFIMMAFSGKVSAVIEKHPSLQILALAFLIMIGLTLILEALGVHINKAFVYVAVAFSLGVEFLNIRFQKNNA